MELATSRESQRCPHRSRPTRPSDPHLTPLPPCRLSSLPRLPPPASLSGQRGRREARTPLALLAGVGVPASAAPPTAAHAVCVQRCRLRCGPATQRHRGDSASSLIGIQTDQRQPSSEQSRAEQSGGRESLFDCPSDESPRSALVVANARSNATDPTTGERFGLGWQGHRAECCASRKQWEALARQTRLTNLLCCQQIQRRVECRSPHRIPCPILLPPSPTRRPCRRCFSTCTQHSEAK